MHPEADRVECSLGRQMHTLGVPEVAVQAKGLVVAARLRWALRAASGKAIAQRKTLAMRPQSTLVYLRRNEIGTSQKPLLNAAIVMRMVCFAYVR